MTHTLRPYSRGKQAGDIARPYRITAAGYAALREADRELDEREARERAELLREVRRVLIGRVFKI